VLGRLHHGWGDDPHLPDRRDVEWQRARLHAVVTIPQDAVPGSIQGTQLPFEQTDRLQQSLSF
jgi:hypothetical protein